MWGWHDGLSGADWIWMTLHDIAAAEKWNLPIVLIVLWFLRDAVGESPRGRDGDRETSALEIARRAYARGELSREQYLQVVADLEQTTGDR